MNKSRPSPLIHASTLDIGTIMRGNDKNMWMVMSSSNKIKKWIKLDKTIKIKYSLDNGGRKYKLVITKTRVFIFDLFNNNKFIMEIKNYKKIIIGSNNPKLSPYKNKFSGTSFLIEITKNTYFYICDIIYKFSTDTPIKKYYSLMGNSSVVYPISITEKYIYLMIEYVYMDYNEWDKKTDPYAYYYGHIKNNIKWKKFKYNNI